ncbi:hypothetical protein P691DRAFT_780855 [Macrolepiota fuliginosa MF-IS2]|uniref:G domain-containing protein n=1 Tax=Macrolepiota fuliginosa MF-IS2 TaxID=1400762 RepID=A0A9P5WZ34_9AGAR|nr:hypothetical protein P691DRAFT_780855 [Macrolepiota fuliginosa MF-IS2]
MSPFLRPAEPGEFMKRAYLSGRLDLTESEIRKVFDDLRNRIIHCLAQVEAPIDFSEGEDLEQGVYDQDNHSGEIIRSDIKLAIFGPPNAGENTLLNYPAQREAAIVTAIPGTTRDILQLTSDIERMPAVVADTTGLRKTEDIVEAIRIGKGIDAVKEVDIALCILSPPDISVSPTNSETGNDFIDPDFNLDNFSPKFPPKFRMPQPPPPPPPPSSAL